MEAPRCYVCFDPDANEKDKDLFMEQVRDAAVPFIIEDWTPKPTVPIAVREQYVKKGIKRSSFMAVLVGRNMPAAENVADEIALARENGVPVFGVYIGSAGTKSFLPEGLPRNRVVRWNRNILDRTIAKVLTEGKNR